MRLRELRKRAGVSQRGLAKALSVSQQAVSKYETRRAEPDIGRLKKIAEYFGVTVDYLIGREEDGKSGDEA